MSYNLNEVAKAVRYLSLKSSSIAGSGHPTSSLSATDLIVALMFGGYFRANLDEPKNLDNDKLIFSKGHASPLFYSIFVSLGYLSEDELYTFRQFGSSIEGHPTLKFPYTEAATGSLGQGLGIGLGMAITARLDKRDSRIWVLLGDSEMAEGSIWEAMELASYNQTSNLIAIADINRLGQRGETILGHDIQRYKLKSEAFGWETYAIDGHNFDQIKDAYQAIIHSNSNKPKMVLAKTYKGKGVSFLDDKDGWHGKVLDENKLKEALAELGNIENLVFKN